MTTAEAWRETQEEYNELLRINQAIPGVAASDDVTGLLELLERRSAVVARVQELSQGLGDPSRLPPKAAKGLADVIRQTLEADARCEVAIRLGMERLREGLKDIERGLETGRAYRRVNGDRPPTARFIDQVR
ncbi:MAG TPA: flagellar protein FliT [Bacillota bacterium]